jgi:hypothetical protein
MQSNSIFYILFIIQHLAKIVGNSKNSIPVLSQVHSLASGKGDEENFELLLNNFWRPTISVIG